MKETLFRRAGSLLVGQAICGVAGVLLVKGLKRGWLKEK